MKIKHYEPILKLLLLATVFVSHTTLFAQQAEMIAPISHTSVVTEVAFSKDYKYVVTGSWDKSVKVWDMASGRLIRNLTGHKNDVRTVAISDDNKYVASGSDDKTAKVWDLETGEVITTLAKVHGQVHNIEFFDGKETVISFGEDDGAVIWNAKTGEIIRKVYRAHSYYSDISRDRKLIGCSSLTGPVRIIDVATGDVLHEMKIGGNDVRKVVFSPDGNYLLARNDKGKIFQWDVKTGKSVKVNKAIAYLAVNKKLSPDGKYQLYMDKKQTLHLKKGDTGEEIREFKKAVSGVQSLAVHPHKNQLLLASQDQTLKLWDLEKASAIRTYSGHTSWVSAIDFTPDGNRILSASWDKLIKLWDVASGAELYSFKPGKYELDALSTYPTGSYAVIDDGVGGFRVINIDDHQEVSPGFGAETNQVNAAAYSHDGTTIATGHHNHQVKIWDVKSNTMTWSYDHGSIVITVAISADGSMLASAGFSSKIHVMDMTTQKNLHTFVGHSAESVKFSPDGKYLLSGGIDNTVRLWDIEAKAQVWIGAHGDEVSGVSFGKNSGENEFVISSSTDGSFKLWDLKTGNEITKTLYFTGSDDFITATPDNYYYASKDAAKDIYFTVGLDLYAFDQFDLQYNRPDIILDRIGLASPDLIRAYKGAYTKRLRKMGFDQAKIEKFVKGEFDKGFNVPTITVADEIRYVETAQKKYSFPVVIDPAGAQLDKLFLSVNGVPVYGVTGKSLDHAGLEAYTYQIEDLILSDGKNIIEVSVLNDNGVSSLKQKIEAVYTGEKSSVDLHVITIGVSQYIDSEMNLDFAAKDANDLAKLLQSKSDKYENVYVHTFLDENATTSNILSIKEKLKASKVDDEVILFVASHGLLDEELNYYIATHDVNFAAPAGKGLAYEDLESLLDEIPARKKLMMIDACHSGEVDKEETVLTEATGEITASIKSRGFKNKTPQKMGLAESFELMQKLFNDLRAGNGAVVISAASGVEFSLESSQWNNGVFTYSLLEGLSNNKCDVDQNGSVEVSELKTYVFERVVELTDGKQHPTSRRENLENDFVVW